MKIEFAPDFFFFPKKMELEDQKQIQSLLKRIICWEARLIEANNDYKHSKANFETSIKHDYREIAILKRKALLKQQGLKWSHADLHLCEKESEKELQRWKNLAPGEKIKEHKERMGLQKDVPPQKEEEDEDWEPMTDIQVDRWIEEENEKEMERLEK